MTKPSILGGVREAIAAAGLSRHPSVIARDPNSTPQELLDVTRWQPEAVLENPSLPLWMVSDERYWRAITQTARFQIARIDLGQSRTSLSPLSWQRVEALAVARMAPKLLLLLGTDAEEEARAAIAYLARFPREGDAPLTRQLGAICAEDIADVDALGIARFHAAHALFRGIEAQASAGSESDYRWYDQVLTDLRGLARRLAESQREDREEAELLEFEACLADVERLIGEKHGRASLKWWQIDERTGAPKPEAP